MRGAWHLLTTVCLAGLFGCAGQTPSKPKTIDPAVLAAGMCGAPVTGVAAATAVMPVFKGLAQVQYPTGSKDAQVQVYFDQGLALLYGFEYETAYSSFKAARDRDPDCAMCAWGMAMALGPNINNGAMAEKTATEARELVAGALKQKGLGGKDRMLLEALAVRYAEKPPEQQGGVFAEKYADALFAGSARWPKDDFIAVLAAEAAMTARPWDYWEAGGHIARPWAAKAIALVETVLKRNPDHPEAIHLYIHLTEASDRPERAEPYADRLGVVAPGSPHLVHMPSHTYYPVGRIGDAIDANLKAIAINEGMARDLGKSPAYFGYYYHHATFILSAAQQVGDKANALRLAGEIEAGTPLSATEPGSWNEAKLIMTMQARAQFMTPAEVLAIKAPPARLHVLTTVWRSARIEAFLAQGNVAAARKEAVALGKTRAAVKGDDDAARIAERHEHLAMGRIAMAAGKVTEAEKHFLAATDTDKRLSYSEPPHADRPAQIAMGRLKLAAEDGEGALKAFDAALKVRPGNAYALWGKAQAQNKLDDAAGYQATMAEFNRIWRGGNQAVVLQDL
jgi:tetratricopeptide (TPR) repeat protein